MFDIVAIAAVLITQFISWWNIFSFSLLFSVRVHCNIMFAVRKTFFSETSNCLRGPAPPGRPLPEKNVPEASTLPYLKVFLISMFWL